MSNSLTAYLLKNYASKPDKKKKKKTKKSNSNKVDDPVQSHHDERQNEDQEDNEEDSHHMEFMPNLNDGSGWNTNNAASNILAPSQDDGSRKRKHVDNDSSTVSITSHKKQKRQRYDTDSEDESEAATHRQATRHDTSSSDEQQQTITASASNSKKVRHDTSSDEDDSDMDIQRKPQPLPAHKSEEEDDSDIDVHRKPSPPDIIKRESDNDSDSDIEVMRKSSDTKTTTIHSQKHLKTRRDDERMESENKTVYRDKNGKRITEDEYIKLKYKDNRRRRGRNRKDEQEEHNKMEWASGLTQRYKRFENQVLVQRQKYNTLARYQDDAEMNMELQNEHKMEDPLNEMEGYQDQQHNHNMKKKKNREKQNMRPTYRGKPWPNRYGILPGYRWDGIDRSNGFETKKMLHSSQMKDRKQKMYRWANEDM